MVTKLVGVKEFRQNMAKYSVQANRYGWHFVVLNRNQPIFEVKPLSKKAAVLDKLAADVAAARRQVREGKIIPLEEALRAVGL